MSNAELYKTIAVRLIAVIIQWVLIFALVYGALWLCRAAWRKFVTQTETTSEVADQFVCPECPYHDKETEDCDCSLDMKCIEHIHAFFQEHELVREKPWGWRLVEKQKAEDMSKTLKESEVAK